MEIGVHEIIIKKRVRKDLGDLGHLMDSMRHHGLLNPILITEDNELIAGHRRLESAIRLGWRTIEARVYTHLTRTEKLEMELNENLFRKDFNEEEVAEGYTRLDRLNHPSWIQRMWLRLVKFIQKFFKIKR
ncbi:MAG: ParB N-terminal domain-containing protein [Spirochaetales bacterium]|nr:ParB N-terminal domain-containing protein [Spirochaetales bacterium]